MEVIQDYCIQDLGTIGNNSKAILRMYLLATISILNINTHNNEHLYSCLSLVNLKTLQEDSFFHFIDGKWRQGNKVVYIFKVILIA